jgi:hypothetical protein
MSIGRYAATYFERSPRPDADKVKQLIGRRGLCFREGLFRKVLDESLFCRDIDGRVPTKPPWFEF